MLQVNICVQSDEVYQQEEQLFGIQQEDNKRLKYLLKVPKWIRGKQLRRNAVQLFTHIFRIRMASLM